MNLVHIEGKRNSTKDALEVLDDLRKRIEDGSVIAFIGVGIEPDDVMRAWSSATQKVTRLRMMGALAQLVQSYHNDPDF